MTDHLPASPAPVGSDTPDDLWREIEEFEAKHCTRRSDCPVPHEAIARGLSALLSAQEEVRRLREELERAASVFDHLAACEDEIAAGRNTADARKWAPMRAKAMRRNAADCRRPLAASSPDGTRETTNGE